MSAKIQERYGMLWLVWRKRKKILKTGRFQSLKNTYRLEEYLSPTEKLKEDLVELALELTDDTESVML